MKYLIVVAHPDDEVLGAGASISKWSKQDIVDVCIMCSEARARAFRPGDDELNSDLIKATKALSVQKLYEGDFPNIEMNTIPHLKLVQFIERAIMDSDPDIIITHHPADPNNDHLQTSLACQEAIRIAQRRPEIKRLREFWYMEVLSATEWAVNSSMRKFCPNCYVEVGQEGVEAKIDALAKYRGVMRPYPHPRSREAIMALAAYRGAQFNMKYAEAFEVVLRRY